ncbi:MAG: nitrate reductase [Cellvibrionaceae bacterium]|nr:nitrate reductase [Cellvibrionaceae bacterium]
MNNPGAIIAREASALAQTVCAYCGVGCGVDIEFEEGVPKSLRGTPEHPANYGRLCVKGQHLLETIGHEDRLLQPMVNKQAVTWPEAVDKVANEFKSIIETHGPDAVAFYVSGQILTEDYYLANKLMKGYIGSANIDTNSRLCMSSAVSAYKRAFGEDVVPCSYEDLEGTDLLVLIGSNAAWTHPVLYQRMERAKRLRPEMKVVLIDPRRSPSAELADLHLPLAPGSDAALYNGLLDYLSQWGGLDEAFISNHCENFIEALQAASEWSLSKTAQYCGLAESDLERFYQLFLHADKAISFYSMGINQSSSGTDKCQSIINAHLASGKILREGCGPFSITGQPNAMGGREVGGLANQLAAHMDIQNPSHRDTVQRYWGSPAMASKPGKMAVDLFDDIAAGKIKALWVMATNPLVSMPNRPKIVEALEALDLLVVSECASNSDMLDYADVLLPASAWLEKNGTVTNSERLISRQRGLISPPGEAKHDWKIISEVAQAMGFKGFDYQHPAEVFNEWAGLTAFENNGQRQLDLSALQGLSITQYDQFKPRRWPFNERQESKRAFKDARFSTASKKAKLYAVQPRKPVQISSAEFPWLINSGRIRDQWHTMTRSGKSASLSGHIDRPYIYLAKKDAEKLKLKAGDILRARSKLGSVTAFAQISEAMCEGQCFMPIHWSKQFASSANVSNLYDSVVDPLSGQPELKQAAVALSKVSYVSHIQIYSRRPLDLGALPADSFYLKSRGEAGFHYYLAMNQELDRAVALIKKLSEGDAQWFGHRLLNSENIYCLREEQCELLAFVSNQHVKLPKAWLEELMLAKGSNPQSLNSVLLAKPEQSFLKGRKVCSCFSVHEKTIVDEIAKGAASVVALGERLSCGTNCGSCKTELSALLKQHARPQDQIASVNV